LEINPLNFEEVGFWNITSVTPSPDKHIWIYDPVNLKILKTNESKEDVRDFQLSKSNELYILDAVGVRKIKLN
jgi:hypothetical protein